MEGSWPSALDAWQVCFACLSLVLAIFYIFIISKYLHGWRALPEWRIPAGFQPKTKVSILIPARNEAANILACLESISQQSYPTPLFEVIVLDDHSEDDTFFLVKNFTQTHPNVRAVRLADFVKPGGTQSFKKKAIETGISLATGELIVTTDADCIVQQGWLALLVSFFEKTQSKFIAAPVNFHRETSLLERFQSLDFLGMMGVTGAGIHRRMNQMCNGANLAYPKAVFHEINGFEGIDHLASGDDMLLMQKIAARHPAGIYFLKNKNATVFTPAKPDLRSFLSQRLRWATKSASYRDWRVTAILGMVFLLCWAIVLSLLAAIFFGWKMAALAAVLLLMKTAADYFFLGEMARYFGRRDLMKNYPASQVLHVLYIVVAGTLANVVKRYDWKGRRVK
jgi:cellulose synthase/poly-beta-1,6-N-acetylglucosamine synthase-like glycosyltransferase